MSREYDIKMYDVNAVTIKYFTRKNWFKAGTPIAIEKVKEDYTPILLLPSRGRYQLSQVTGQLSIE